MDDIATKFLKTYQVWHHRRLLVSRVRKLEYELEFVAQGLKEVDPKNYHTWAYRQWILSNFNEDSLWAGELSFVEDLLRRDIRNNSAWHHRFFVVWDSGVRSGETNRDEILARELRWGRVFLFFLRYSAPSPS
jgi:protein farnesyltransferase/geranylgeranyltransferase type-1 subunit alpha